MGDAVTTGNETKRAGLAGRTMALAIGVAMLFATVAGSSVQANDSSGFMGTSGLQLTRSDAIEMRTEDLTIRLDGIHVIYVFRNMASEPVSTMMVFPFPSIDLSQGSTAPNWNFPQYGAREFLDFQVSVDGRAVVANLEQRASFRGQDVTGLLKRAGALDLVPWTRKTWPEQMSRMPPAAVEELKRAGLVAEGEDSPTDPQWTLHLKAYWTQEFPPGTDVRVEHRYRPFVGTALSGPPSQITGREPVARLNGSAGTPMEQDRYCIDAPTRRGLQAMERKAGTQAVFQTSEIEYILTTARNWRGPIGRFRLTIDKGAVENILSLCWSGLRKTGPTTFTFEAGSWTPDRDLKLLIVHPPPL